MSLRRGRSVLVAAAIGWSLAACGNGPGGAGAGTGAVEDPGRPDTEAGVLEVLGVVAPALADADGPRVCSLLAPAAQRRLEARYDATTCVGAVPLAARELATGGRAERVVEADWQIAVLDGRATVDGDAAGALADVLGYTELALIRVEGRWAVS